MKLTERIYWVGSGAVGLSGQGDCHVYVVEGSEGLALIDCGMSQVPAGILATMKKDGLDPKLIRYVLLTHAHPDHAGACNYLRDTFGARIACSEYEGRVLREGPYDFFRLQGDGEAVRMWRDQPKCTADRILEDGELIDLGDIKVSAILTPGHTAGSLSYLTEISGKRQLFSGDTIFYKGFISLLSPPFSSHDLYRQGMEKLADRNIDGLFPSHLMWVLEGGQQHIDTALQSFRNLRLPAIKPFS